MDCLETIHTRRSIRRFSADAVTGADIEVLLRAAMAAPSATNERPWRFVVVRDRAVLDKLARATPFAGALGGAQVGIVVCAEKRVVRYPGSWVIDCSAAIENLLLAATASDLGGVWIGVHPVAPFAAAVRRAVGLPRGIAAHSMVALGHPAETKPSADKFDPAFIHVNRW